MPSLPLADIIDLLNSFRDKTGERSATTALIRNVNTNMVAANAAATSPQTQTDVVAQIPEHTHIEGDSNALAGVIEPESTPLHPMEEMLLNSFYSLTKREQLNIISGFVLSNRKTIAQEKEKFTLDRDKQFFTIKAWMAKIGFGVGVGAFSLFFGMFCYGILKNGTMADSGVLTGLLNTLLETMKIIFTANLT